MTHIALVGSGKIGSTICELLLGSGDYDVTLLDTSEEDLARVADADRLSKQRLDVTDTRALGEGIGGHFAVLNAGPFYLTSTVAETAKARGVDSWACN